MSDTQNTIIDYSVVVPEDFAFNSDERVVLQTEAIPAVVDYYSHAASSGTSLNSIQFDVNIGNKRCLSRFAYVRFPSLEFTVADAGVTAALSTPSAWLTKAENFKKIAFRPYGIMNLITSSLRVGLNDRTINEFSQLKEIIALLHKSTDTSEQLPWLINSAGDLFQEYDDYNNLTGGALKPKMGPSGAPVYLPLTGDLDSPFFIDNGYSRLNNRRLVPEFVPSSIGEFKWRLRDVILPIPLSVFMSNVKEGATGLYGVDKLSVSFDLNQNAQRMFSVMSTTTAGAVKFANNISFSTIDTPQLILKLYSPPTSLLKQITHSTLPQYVKDYSIPIFKTDLLERKTYTLPANRDAGTSITKGAVVSMSFNNVLRSIVPEFLYIQIAKIDQSTADSIAHVPDVSCLVDKLSVTVNGVTSLHNASALDIIHMNNKNGLQVSPLHQLYTHGNGYILLDLRKDLGVPGDLLVNQQAPLSIRIDMTCQNLRIAPTGVAENDTFEARLFASSTDVLSYSKGDFSVGRFMDKLSPAEQDMLYKHVEQYVISRPVNMIGAGNHGGFLGSLFKKVLPLVKKYGWSALKGAYDGVKGQIEKDKGGVIRPTGGRNNIIGGLAANSRDWM